MGIQIKGMYCLHTMVIIYYNIYTQKIIPFVFFLYTTLELNAWQSEHAIHDYYLSV